ncbi:MAG TPA: hypothetical protein VGB53_08935 [Rubricoccaceae bacterium]|jgi:hypothetical protein
MSHLRSSLRLLILVATLASLPGCMSLLTGGPLVREGEPTGTLFVRNDSGIAINVVLISTCSASSYGLNRLPRGTSIAPGQAYPFTVSAGCWDVDAGSTAASVEARQRLTVPASGSMVYTVTS